MYKSCFAVLCCAVQERKAKVLAEEECGQLRAHVEQVIREKNVGLEQIRQLEAAVGASEEARAFSAQLCVDLRARTDVMTGQLQHLQARLVAKDATIEEVQCELDYFIFLSLSLSVFQASV